MPGVPRVYNKFYDRIKGLMDAATGLKGMIVKQAIKSKLENLKENAEYTSCFWDKLVFN